MKHLFKLTSLAFIEVLIIVLIFAEFYHIGKVVHITTSEIPVALAIQNSTIFSILKLLVLLYVGVLAGIYAVIEYKDHKLSNKLQKVVLRDVMESIKKVTKDRDTVANTTLQPDFEEPNTHKKVFEKLSDIYNNHKDIEIRESITDIKPFQFFYNKYGKVGDNLKACTTYLKYIDSVTTDTLDKMPLTTAILEMFIRTTKAKLEKGSIPYVSIVESDIDTFVGDCMGVLQELEETYPTFIISEAVYNLVVAVGRKFIINP